MLTILNLPLVGIWARLIACPADILAPAILTFACIGILASGGTGFDVLSLGFFGLLGFACRRTGLPLMPLLLGFVLIAPFEDHLRRAITQARGDWSVILAHPGLLAVFGLFGLAWLAKRSGQKKRHAVDGSGSPDRRGGGV
jgi:TctA family transporter